MTEENEDAPDEGKTPEAREAETSPSSFERSKPASVHLGVFLLCLGLLAGVYGVSWVALLPPEVKDSTAPSDEFSATRAMKVLTRILGDEAPHPMGSAAHAEVRAEIVSVLEELGYEPEIQETLMTGPYGVFGTVRNVVVRIDGQRPDNGVLLAAHYDSVPVAPGAADDGVGVVAILEVARILASEGPPLVPIILLLDDGEESGLLGAKAFLEHRWFLDVKRVVNLEARGTSGPSLMFETSHHNAELISRFGSSVPRPISSSLFYSVYQRMPNDTDFSVFREHGLEGFNLAFIGDVNNYHSPRDDLEHLDPRSLQHQGDSLLALTRSLAFAEPPPAADGDAVFFDLLGRFLIRWPVAWTLPMALLVLVALGAALVRVLAGYERWVRTLALGASLWLVIPALVVAGGMALETSLQSWGMLPSPFVAHPGPTLALYWSIGFVLTWLVRIRPGDRLSPEIWWLVHWCFMGVLAVAVTLWDARASYPLLVPAAGAAGLAWVALLRGGRSGVTDPRWFAGIAVVSALFSGLFWFPLAILFQEALGLVAPISVLPVVITALSIAPLLPARWASARFLFVGLCGLAMLCALLVTIAPVRTEARPGALNLLHVTEADEQKAHWVVAGTPDRLPAPLREELEPVQPRPDLPGWPKRWKATAGEAPWVEVPAPELTVLESTTRTIQPEGAKSIDLVRDLRVRIRSQRGAPVVALYLPPDVDLRSIALAGGGKLPVDPKRRQLWYDGWRVYRCLNADPDDPDGIELLLTVGGDQPIEAAVQDASQGLPDSAAALLEARPSNLSPRQSGDRSIVVRRVRL